MIPLISAADLLWAIGTKAGLGVTFGLGLYKLENIHVLLQVVLLVMLSLVFVFSASRGEESIEVEGEYLTEPAEQKAH